MSVILKLPSDYMKIHVHMLLVEPIALSLSNFSYFLIAWYDQKTQVKIMDQDIKGSL